MCALFVELSQISLDFKHNEKPTENTKRRADDDQGKHFEDFEIKY